MAKEVKIPKEVREYKEKLLNQLTLRQFISILIGSALSFLVYYICRLLRQDDWTVNIISVLWLFIALVGFSKFGGLNFEVFLLKYIQNEFLISKFIYRKGAHNE